MRHLVRGRKLGRDTGARHALLSNLANDLILHGRVKTTLAKAKFVQGHAEKLVTKAKKSKLGQRRILASSITNKAFVKLVDEIAPGFEQRNGGFTRIVKLMPRTGDNAPMARIELLEWDKSKAKIRKSDKEKKTAKGTKKLSAKSNVGTKKSTIKKPAKK